MTTARSTPDPHRPRPRTGFRAHFGTRSRARSRRGPAFLAAGAVLVLGAGLTACEGGVALCLDDHKCTVGIKTDKADGTKTVKVFGGDNPMEMTVGHITDNSAEVTIGDRKKTAAMDSETSVNSVRITLRKVNKADHYAELHVERD
ncbi:hypothetical protein ACGF0D_26825 [Kitasatospora sp. NPDC048298]|uniref:hypothetical protein n=1 Tax=Kitasatospora sp. NPDC048298 TaxID=3364049 RepID=UPI003716EFCD